MSVDTDQVGVERAEEFARSHPDIVKFARAGWFAKGLVYTLTGVLALVIGVNAVQGSADSDTEASQTGAIARIAENSFGAVLLVVVAAGLVVYSIWRLISVLLPADNGIKGWLGRGGYLISALTYLVLAWTAITFVLNPGKSDDSEDSKVNTFTTDLMTKSFGRALVVVIGLVLVGIAIVFVGNAVTASFARQLNGGRVGPLSHDALIVLGRIGWIGRASMMALIGFFLVRAAIRFDPDDAQGLDGSLRNAAASGPGTVFVLVVAVGLIVYGLFCALSAPKRRLVGAGS